LCRNEAGTFGWAVSLKHSRIISGDSGPPAVACFNGISRNGAENHLKKVWENVFVLRNHFFP
jgi:hypothetical protein